ANELGIIESLPKKGAALLDVGKEITLADVDKLLKKRTEEKQARRGGSVAVKWVSGDKIDREGRRVRIINPNLHPLEFEMCKEAAEQEGGQGVGLESDPILLGQCYQMDRARKYPS